MSTTEVTSYTELIEAIKARVGELGIRYEDFDTLASFPDGLAGKAFGPAQVKRLGPEKIFDALRCAGLRLKVEVDPEQTEKMQGVLKAKLMHPRQANQARPNNHSSPAGTAMMSRVFKHLSKLGGKARMSKMSRAELRKHQQAASNARWAKVRKRAKAAAKGARTRKDRLALMAKPAEQGVVL